jgi:thiosulfate/3-mercaptopyruvate sulfurtransferase
VLRGALLVLQAAWTVSGAELARERARPDAPVTVVDARGPWAYYVGGHLPGAVWLPWWRFRDGRLRTGALPRDLDALARRLADAGIDQRRPVVVYGDARGGWGEEGRVAWMLHYVGHPSVRVLDGGVAAWRRAGGRLTRRVGRPPRGRFAARPVPAARASAADVARAPTTGAVLLDVRSDAEWAGARRYLSRTGGRIPGAVHLVWRDLLAPDGTIDRSAALAARLASLGLSPDRAVIAYCVGGVRSGEAFVALKALGFRDVRNYDGSWWDWERRR